MMHSSHIVFGLRELPAPPRMGALFYRFSTKLGRFNEHTLVVFDLYNTDEEYLSGIFREGLEKLLTRKDFLQKGGVPILQHYETENMRDFARDVFDRVLQEMTTR